MSSRLRPRLGSGVGIEGVSPLGPLTRLVATEVIEAVAA